MEMGEQSDTPLDHGHGFGNHDGASAQGGGPVTLLSVGPFQGDALVLALIMDARSQRLVVNDMALVGFRGDVGRAQATSASIKEPSSALPRLRVL